VVLFDSTQEELRHSKLWRYVITMVVFIALVVGTSWYLLRFYKEKDTIRYFLNTVAAGNMQQAYQIWKPSESYSFKDFLDDWGPDGYYGPVKSYRVERAAHRKNGSGVDIIVDVSPYKPFPSDDDAAKQSKTKEIDLWVQFTDHSISFPPPAL
jgi:hypothetical protein